MPRPKINEKLTFKIVTSKEEFDQIEATHQIFNKHPVQSIFEGKRPQKTSGLATPFTIIKPPTSSAPFRQLTPDYIRLPYFLNLPKPHTYELTERDLKFIE